MESPLKLAQINETKSTNIATPLNISLTFNDTNNVAAHQFTPIFFVKETGGSFYNLNSTKIRTDHNGKLILTITPNASVPVGTSEIVEIGVHRPNVLINASRGDKIGSIKVTITNP